MEIRGDEEGNCNVLMTLPKITEANYESISERPIAWPIFKSDT
jgi:hypothetical protein